MHKLNVFILTSNSKNDIIINRNKAYMRTIVHCFFNYTTIIRYITYFAIENNTNMSIFCFLSKVDIAILPSLKYGIAFDAVWRRRKLTGDEYDL